MLKPILAALLALSFAVPVRAEPAPDGRALLQRVSGTYRALSSYQFEGAMNIRMSGAAEDQNGVGPAAVAADRAGRTRLDLRHPQMGGLLVSDGRQTSTFVTSLSQYMQKPAEAVSDSAGMPKPPQNSPLARYFDPLQDVKTADITGEQQVMVGGAAADCWVVRCDMEPPQPIAIDSTARATVTFWVEKARTLVLRDSISIRLRNRATGANMEMDQVTRFTLGRVNEPLPDSLFAFTPPAGAQRVQTFGPQAGPETVSSLVGKPAPPFTLKGVKGSTVSLASYKGKVVLLDFWATWCRPCRIEMPRVEALYKEFKAKGLVVFGINVAEDLATVKGYLAQNPYTMPILLDLKRVASQLYQAEAIPTLVVIGKDGKISSYFTGVREENVLREALAKAGLK
jgi:peroxiredoxin/outer membrane lipoprotein-sorting protein